ncbi:acetyl-CoA C-acetyltransferase, partial [Guyparkeria sp. 1SP6A2]|nr:acetyl-CoA C-acetyltransferase [Guyparkeria sp. 1SP6A2]
SALILASHEAAQRHGVKPLAKMLGHATHSRHPSEFTIAPVGAIEKLMKKLGWGVNDVDLCEIHVAVAVVPLMAMANRGVPQA